MRKALYTVMDSIDAISIGLEGNWRNIMNFRLNLRRFRAGSFSQPGYILKAAMTTDIAGEGCVKVTISGRDPLYLDGYRTKRAAMNTFHRAYLKINPKATITQTKDHVIRIYPR